MSTPVYCQQKLLPLHWVWLHMLMWRETYTSTWAAVYVLDVCMCVFDNKVFVNLGGRQSVGVQPWCLLTGPEAFWVVRPTPSYLRLTYVTSYPGAVRYETSLRETQC